MPLIIATPRTIAIAVSVARNFRPARPFSATAIIGELFHRDEDHVRVGAPTSLTITPSARKRMRSAIAAARGRRA